MLSSISVEEELFLQKKSKLQEPLSLRELLTPYSSTSATGNRKSIQINSSATILRYVVSKISMSSLIVPFNDSRVRSSELRTAASLPEETC